MLTLDLHSNFCMERRASYRVRCFRLFFRSILLYAAWFAALASFEPSSQGVLLRRSSVAAVVSQRAELLASRFQERDLALNFLGNIRSLDQEMKSDFSSSGLMHLLAISGGQIEPVVSMLSVLCLIVAGFLVKRRLSSKDLFRWIFLINAWLRLIFSLLICAAFGTTGALLRASVLGYARNIPIFMQATLFIWRYFPQFCSISLQRICMLWLMFGIFGVCPNDLSFLLSATGAFLAGTVRTFLSRHMGESRDSLVEQGRRHLIECALTSFLVSSVLSPFQSSSWFATILANLFALSVVNLVITPLSLLLILSSHEMINHLLISGLDSALALLASIAHLFADAPNWQVAGTPPAIFSAAAKVYMALLLILGWSAADVLEEKWRWMGRKPHFLP